MRHITLAAILIAATNLQAHAENLDEHTYKNYVDKSGNISLPSDVRKTWSHLGSWIVGDKKSPGYGFHDVYTQPGLNHPTIPSLETHTLISGLNIL